MVLVTNNWRYWFIGTAASLVIFLVIFFAVIQPSQNTANQAIKTGLQQTQQAVNQAQKQLSTASGQAGAASGQAAAASGQAAAASGQASKQLSKAAKLAQCVVAAGTDPTKVQACQVKYAG
jgi:hypothetical protein